MSHPSDDDRFATPYPEQNNGPDQQSDQPWAQSAPGSPSSGWSSASAGDPGQSYGSPQAPPAYGPASPAAGPQIPQGDSWAPAAQKSGEVNFFRAMFDFKFDHFITVKFSSFLYIVAILVALLLWLGQIVSAVVFGSLLGSMGSFYGEASFNAVPLVLAIVFGWIPSVISLIAMRLGLEFSVATVRTAQNTTRIADAAAAGR